LVEEGNLVRRRSKYEAINSFDLTDFPVLTMDDLRDLTMGVYQLKQAPQYFFSKKRHSSTALSSSLSLSVTGKSLASVTTDKNLDD
jgi:hypothetical protein